MNIFGIVEITWGKKKQDDFDALCLNLNEYGYRAVKITADLTNKRVAVKVATQSRVDATQTKIDEAMAILSHQDKPVTAYGLAKLAKISQTTAKKYLATIGIETKRAKPKAD